MRRTLVLILLFSSIFFYSGVSDARKELAVLPPRGWNSYDSFSWMVDEDAFLHNAALVADKLLPYGYEYVVVDFLWYRKNATGSKNQNAIGFDHIDHWGRPYPDPKKWPSSRDGKGFREVARKVHKLGLKFGIHVMRGISAQAVNASTPILDVIKGGPFVKGDRKWQARDIGMRDHTCGWLKGFMSVDTDTEAGRAFLRSLYCQYASWGVDFVKLDCVFGDDLSSKEIITVSELLKELDRPVVLSISPGSHVTPSMAEGIRKHVNMYRITGDDWDKWKDVAAHFNVSRDFAVAKRIGAKGMNGRSWPDLDMLPFGWLTDPGVPQGPHRKCNLTSDEQKTQMTLWSMAKSPLMFGGDVRKLDTDTYNLMTNPVILEINYYSSNNMELPYVTGKKTYHNVAQKSSLVEQPYTSENYALELTSSKESAKGWYLSHDGEICWQHKIKSNYNISCLYKRGPSLTMDEEGTYKLRYQGKFQLLADRTKNLCLSATVNTKLDASETAHTLFSACKWSPDQLWELTEDGALVSSYSGLFATIKKTEPTIRGVRSWVATGREGEVYVSFFNLEAETMLISAGVENLAKVLGLSYVSNGWCEGSEVWSGNKYTFEKTIEKMVNPHGCALFVFKC